MGLQLCGPIFSERTILGAAHAYEKATQHAKNNKLAAELGTVSGAAPGAVSC
jgi:hypothetical protein